MASDARTSLAIGDMVWGRGKYQPWWPGQIYNESNASLPVLRSKREGYVLVAFFGDGSYEWFDPAELLPFEPNFAEKSRQTSQPSFLNSVSEALNELSRRSMLGLSCRCRNKFNVWLSSDKGYLVVDVGENKASLYSGNQINKARESFRPNEMLSFVKRLASTPMNDGQHKTIEFIKNRANVLACRKAIFEEFDETYAQTFGIVTEDPPRLTAPAVIYPSKASLYGRLVIAESLGNGEISIKPTKTKDQVEKEQDLSERRDEPTQHKKPQKEIAGGQSGDPLFAGVSKFSGRALYSGAGDNEHQMPAHFQSQPSSYIKTSDGSRKLVDIGTKKGKLHKSPAENANPIEKKRKGKEISTETSSDSAVAVDITVEKIRKMSHGKERDGGGKVELQTVVSGLRALALDPLHATETSSLALVQQVLLKYRSIVFKNRKRGPLDGPEDTKKKGKIDASEDVTKNICEATGKNNIISEEIKATQRIIDSAGISKKKIISGSSSKSVAAVEKKLPSPQRPNESRDVSSRSMPPPKTLKLDHHSRKIKAKRMSQPAMLVMEFPEGAKLPSVGILTARFDRFGPMDNSAARVFEETHTCRLIFNHRIDAEAALRIASGSSNLFGSTNVRCYLSDVEPQAAAPESE